MLSVKRGPIPTALLLTAASEFILAASPPTATSARFASPMATPLRDQYGLGSPIGSPAMASAARFSAPLNTPSTAHWHTTTFFDSEEAIKESIKEEDESAETGMGAAAEQVLPEDDVQQPSKWKVFDMASFPGLAALSAIAARPAPSPRDVPAEATEEAVHVSRSLQMRGLKGRPWKGIDFSDFPGIGNGRSSPRIGGADAAEGADANVPAQAFNRRLVVEGVVGRKSNYPRSPYPSAGTWDHMEDMRSPLSPLSPSM